MPHQIELLVTAKDPWAGETLMAVIDYEITKTPYINRSGEVGAIFKDVEIDSIAWYKENGKAALYQLSEIEKIILKERILKHHDNLEIEMSQIIQCQN